MNKLGIEPVQLLTQVINFLVMVVLLTKFLYKPITRALAERKAKIEAGLKYAEDMKAELLENDKRKKDIVAEAKDEARRIVEEAKISGRKLEAEIVEKAHKEAESLVEKGRSEIDVERREMEKQLRDQTVSVAQAMVSSVLGENLDLKSQRMIIDKKISKLAQLAK